MIAVFFYIIILRCVALLFSNINKTKARESKGIRYPCSPSYKLCPLHEKGIAIKINNTKRVTVTVTVRKMK